MAFVPQFFTFEQLFEKYLNFGEDKEKNTKKVKFKTQTYEPIKLESPPTPPEEINATPTLKKSKKKRSSQKLKSEKNKTGKKKHHRSESNKSIPDVSENKENNTQTENTTPKISEKSPENTELNKLIKDIKIIDKDKAIEKLVRKIKNFLFIKKVKKLIKLHKENFAIVCTNNSDDLTLNTNLEQDDEEVEKYKLNFDPILQENITYIPRKKLSRKNLLKFTFINKNNEVIIDPKYNTEFDSGTFINVINIKKLKEKEEEKEEDFQSFLENYFTDKTGIRLITANTKLSLEQVRPEKKHKTLDSDSKLLFKQKNKSCIGLSSILRQRRTDRIPSNKKISFGKVKYSYYKNK